MILHLTAKIKATGEGSKSALAKCDDDVTDLESLFNDAALEWAEQHESDIEKADITWNVEVTIDD